MSALHSLRPSDVHGVWKLFSVEQNNLDTGELVQIHGGKPSGYIHYDPSGRMLVVITSDPLMRPEKSAIPAMSEAEQAQCFRTVAAYGGTFSIEGDQVLHDVDIAWIPGWFGRQDRRVQWRGRQLVLQTEPGTNAVYGKRTTTELVWEKVGATDSP
jgi:hypothetical protein